VPEKKTCLFILISIILFSCIWKPGGNRKDRMSSRPIEAVLKEYTDSLMALPGVVGTAQGLCTDDIPCIKVYVSEWSEELKEKLPRKLEGYLVDVEVTGNIKALPDN
jgi:hypothetical protein